MSDDEEISKIHHYVPVWYQRRFLPGGKGEFFVFDKHPDLTILCPDGVVRPIKKPKYVYPSGPFALFQEEGLYSVALQGVRVDAIERHVFGKIDESGKRAMELFDIWPKANGFIARGGEYNFPDRFGNPAHRMSDLTKFIDVQKLRTPKGLARLKPLVLRRTRKMTNNEVISMMLERQERNCTMWLETRWEIFSAARSTVKFLLSDDPILHYNMDCYPLFKECVYPSDPSPFWKGTRILYPLSPDRILVLTHSQHMDDPNREEARKNRRNARVYDQVMLNFTKVRNERELDDQQVATINGAIKARATRWIASARQEELFPKDQCEPTPWCEIDRLFHPEHRTSFSSSEVIVRYKDDSILFTNAYGERERVPGHFVRAREMAEKAKVGIDEP